jgi:uncharacterized protein (DUF433 family)
MVEGDDAPAGVRQRIIVDPAVLGGKPVVKGTRISVSLILNLVAHGYTIDRVVQAYPNLSEEDVKAAILYAEARVDGEKTHLLVGPT